ncbi:hypothetical protein ACFE04_020434 [Oxalis oulophora]
MNAAKESKDSMEEELYGSHMVFVTAGMEWVGGTGTGGAPIIAGTAKSMGILTSGLYFSALMVIPGLVNVDFADVRAIMANAGSSLMGIGTATAMPTIGLAEFYDLLMVIVSSYADNRLSTPKRFNSHAVLGPMEHALAAECAAALQAVRLPKLYNLDKSQANAIKGIRPVTYQWIWNGNIKSIYTVKSGYYLARDLINNDIVLFEQSGGACQCHEGGIPNTGCLKIGTPRKESFYDHDGASGSLGTVLKSVLQAEAVTFLKGC